VTTFPYTRTAATASRLIERFGAVAVLKHLGDATYDPATSTATPAVTQHPTVAVVVDYDHRQIDGTLIRQGDRRAYMDASVAPRQGDVLAWQGADLQIVAVRPLSPAGTAVLYEAQLRG